MSAPGNWVLGAELRDATAAAMRHWLSEHPHRKRPTHCTPEEELRDYAWALHRLPVASVPFVAERVVQRSRGHWPKLSEVRDEVTAFLKRHLPDAGVWVKPEAPREDDATARAQLAQAQAILRALELDGPEVSRPSQLQAIAKTVDAIMERMRGAVAAGKLTPQHIEDFRNGAFPSNSELEEVVRDIAAEGQADVRAHVDAMLAAVPVPA